MTKSNRPRGTNLAVSLVSTALILTLALTLGSGAPQRSTLAAESGFSANLALAAEPNIAPESSIAQVERQFRELPMEARRWTGPLFWLHGDESRARLEEYVGKVAEGGNGCFTAESRPHSDWLGEGWYRDLGICLEAAKKLGLKMWIFDEKWWPSGEVGGKVPPQYGTTRLIGEAKDVAGPAKFTDSGYSGPNFVAAVAVKPPSATPAN